MRIVSILVALLTASVVDASSHPNIVFILADDLGYGDVQCLNPQRGKIPTPHLDRLAAQGMTFTDAHSGSSVCTPTRYGLLTGRYAWRTRLQEGVLDGGNEEPLISADRITVASLLRDQGYATACIGKWHLGFLSDTPTRDPGPGKVMGAGLPLGAVIQGGPTTRGFDLFWGCSNARAMDSLIDGDRVVEMLPYVEMLPRLTQQAVNYIGEQARSVQRDQPFFLYVPLTSPHSPVVPTPQWQGKSGLGLYGDFVMQTDDTVGRILEALEMHGLADNTMVIFTSDNGCAVSAGVEKLEEQGHFVSGEYRGYKTDVWEGGHRMPFFVRWPGVVEPGSQNQTTICLVDFMATVAEMTGAIVPDTAAPDSVSFLPAFSGTPIVTQRKFIVHHSQKGQFAIRQGKWKLTLGGGSGGSGRPTDEEAQSQGIPDAQLYDLDADPGETTNLVMDRPKVASRMLKLLQHDVDRGRSTPGRRLDNDIPVKLPSPTAIRVSE